MTLTACGQKGRVIQKMLLTMRMVAFLLLAACLQVSARTYSQNLTLSFKNAPLEKVFMSIQKQSGYNFNYKMEILSKSTPVSIDIKNGNLEQVLDLLFKDQPLTYTIVDKNIGVKLKEVVKKETDLLPAETVPLIDIHGRITDSLGSPLAGASIVVKGNKRGVQTDLMGDFLLRGVDPNALITISFTGYETRQIRLQGRSFVEVRLTRNNSPLDEVHVIAYGTDTRRFSVGSVSTVTSEEIERQPVSNVLLALAGQVPGLAITATNGVPGSTVKVQIRGQNTVQPSLRIRFAPYDQPLFIIDGVPFAPQNTNINQLGALGGNNTIPSGISPFNSINPSDIESISILRDADATSIYGTQGSNGVILITTKKGKPGKTTVNVSVNTGFNWVANPIKVLNTQQYLQVRNQAFKNDGLTPSDDPNNYNAYAPDLTIFDQNKYTNWQKTIFDRTSHNTDAHATLTGGSQNTTFLLSGGYTVSDYNFPGNFSSNRSSLHSSLNHNSPNNRFSVNFTTDYSYSQNNSGNFGGNSKVFLPPNTPALLDSTGKLLWNYKGVDISSYQFYSYIKQPTTLENNNLNNAMHLSYKLAPGLNLSASLGYSRNSSVEKELTPASSQSPQYPNSYAYFANSTYQTINIEPQLDYNHRIGKGDLSLLAGSTYKKNVVNSNFMYGNNYPSDAVLGSISGAGYVQASDAYTVYRYSAVFGRIKYVYDQKYIISLTGRRDGSSNFGPGNQFGDFGSAGLGWIFSEEKAIKNALPFMSYAKISGNYGTSGSDGISPYQYQAFWQPASYVPDFQGARPFTPLNLYNPNYSWALKKSLNLGLDLGFFHNRLLVNATYYQSREGNQLVNYTLPTQAGFPNVLENLDATIQNTGWEFSLTSTNIKTNHFSWTTSFNISANHNKLLSFPGLANSSYASYYTIGHSTSEIVGYRYKDVDPATGVFEFYTADGKTTFTPDYRAASLGGDQVPIANTAPKFFGGLSNNLFYKNFSVAVVFQFSKQTALNHLAALYSTNYIPGTLTNMPVQDLNKDWKNPGDRTTQQKLTASNYGDAGNAAQDFVSSSGAYSEDFYVRLKTLSITYKLPDPWLKKLAITNFSLYVRGQNLLTFTNYKVGDPEQPGSFDAIPLQRTLACGLSFNF